MLMCVCYNTDVCSQLFGSIRTQLRDLQNHIAVGLHGCPGDRPQPIIRRVLQLWDIVTYRKGVLLVDKNKCVCGHFV